LRNNLIIAKWVSIFILLVVASGYRPKYTSLFHWYISFSFCASSFVIEGGDQITQNLTLLLIPFFIFDNRKNHWLNEPNKFQTNSWTLIIYFIIRLQACFVYLQASIGKLKVDEWRDGTALYYWLNNNFVGSPIIIRPIVNYLTTSPKLLTISTWSSIIIEFLIFMCISSFKKQRIYFLIIGFIFVIIIVVTILNIFIVVLILNIIAIFYFIFPPRKANYIYGYRTSKTLQNNKVFKYANKHASRYLLILSVINTVLNTILAFSK